VSGSTEPVESLWVERLAEVSVERIGVFSEWDVLLIFMMVAHVYKQLKKRLIF
jgi:hypothetical protein